MFNKLYELILLLVRCMQNLRYLALLVALFGAFKQTDITV